MLFSTNPFKIVLKCSQAFNINNHHQAPEQAPGKQTTYAFVYVLLINPPSKKSDRPFVKWRGSELWRPFVSLCRICSCMFSNHTCQHPNLTGQASLVVLMCEEKVHQTWSDTDGAMYPFRNDPSGGLFSCFLFIKFNNRSPLTSLTGEARREDERCPLQYILCTFFSTASIIWTLDGFNMRSLSHRDGVHSASLFPWLVADPEGCHMSPKFETSCKRNKLWEFSKVYLEVQDT